MIRFTQPTYIGDELENITNALATGKLSGDGEYTKKAVQFLAKITGHERILLTGSCSHALDMAAMMMNLDPGDEVIMPSFTFVSTANAFVLQGAVPVFVDIHPETMNIDESLIEDAITDRTKAICVMHYASVACAMEQIMRIAEKHNLFVVEDAAQAIDAYYDFKGTHSPLGTIGDFGAFSFHDTKNITSGGEGGALLVNNEKYWEAARIIREKGTNRSQFFEGLVDKYTWVTAGSSYLMAEINAAYLTPQLEMIEKITEKRTHIWNQYNQKLLPLVEKGHIETVVIPEYAQTNGHIFYIKVGDQETRSALISYLKEQSITAPFHYIPLHSSPAGKRFARFNGQDKWTTRESSRLIRLPVYHSITEKEVDEVVRVIKNFFGNDNE